MQALRPFVNYYTFEDASLERLEEVLYIPSTIFFLRHMIRKLNSSCTTSKVGVPFIESEDPRSAQFNGASPRDNYQLGLIHFYKFRTSSLYDAQQNLF